MTDFEVMPFRLATKHQPGTAVVPAPGTQGFWVAHSERTTGTARLSWAVQDGDYRVVIMNADGSPGVDVDGRFAVVLPSAFTISMTVLGTGVALGLLGRVGAHRGPARAAVRDPSPAARARTCPGREPSRVGDHVSHTRAERAMNRRP